ncbi:DUF5391 family protein [Viridibacillus sp. FSL R5-0477]|uniref:YxaJ protein n=1 Tax=Viridibacillus arenosi FSL R5-213 TaxID=1227360 RepID=W4ELN5_9BACL|nr:MULTISPECIES: DUF5391 family protein [Viridibacillus]ETT81463.1 hypothetical protein C176_18422 [Viridibacillus arenosi FSL R5-213]OMC80058.1 hypothetical protein BK130_18445 [Viridibacillus sp. FSL H8-0123]OMC84338.1 hypothetical protein BK128_17345 [Viridibacillus sp. FSL H7-0596]OMC89662.1 hypothetical protein BK137_16420 [Viridibacillus arenosi]
MVNKKGVIVMTLISAILFCSLIIASSLTPISDLGPNTNKFGSVGMWLGMLMILFCYLLPVILFLAGINAMKFVMAIFCGFGILIFTATIGTVFVLGIVQNIVPEVLVVVAICLAAIIVNISWFFVAFRPSNIRLVVSND